ncbi:MAG: ABC transporter involved in cytochrome c biogenesis, CcmB subunit [uncultured Aureispira sp.]|uniref:ABC transporter involved in cytochrome c biogenesis, CcmB subunit n=1 Tax=uncultured Aureispira sp. TaxID=1331704 RepID=A0A6S6SGY8_9BACT|nr:MAG: ABC transporter involved in cytochrome c biogenesis, CcmB subunit [uncultured Aureispira sp.]
MNILTETKHLLLKEIRLEFRQKYAISGILLYVISTVFVVYITLGQEVGGAIWAALFWIIVLFASVNAIAKSFVQESPRRQLYYYSLSNPASVILAKMIYNALLLLAISFLAFFVFSVVVGNPIQLPWLFYQTLALGALGFSITFTFISAISAKANQSATLMAVLSFPVIIPMLMTLMRLTKISVGLMTDSAYYKDMLILLCIDVILGALAFILFPYLWRD